MSTAASSGRGRQPSLKLTPRDPSRSRPRSPSKARSDLERDPSCKYWRDEDNEGWVRKEKDPQNRAFKIHNRLELADMEAKLQQHQNPQRIAEMQFGYFPRDEPRYSRPGSLGFCHAFNRPGGSICKASEWHEREFQDAVMCRSKTGYVRVHGCLWCGGTDHAMPDCRGPALPSDQIQMTLPEWQKFQPEEFRTAREARDHDARTKTHRDGKMRAGPTGTVRSHSQCRADRKDDGSVAA